MFTAEMAREEVAKNEKRNQTIKELINRTEEHIKYACKNGERNAVLHDTEYHWEQPYTEVHTHFKKLGYDIKRYRDGSGYYLTW